MGKHFHAQFSLRKGPVSEADALDYELPAQSTSTVKRDLLEIDTCCPLKKNEIQLSENTGCSEKEK